MTARRFRKRPVEVEAVRWLGDNFAELRTFAGWKFEDVDPADRGDDPDRTGSVFDELHNTWVGVYTGQWVIKGVKGEFYPVDDDVLTETYEPVDAPGDRAIALTADQLALIRQAVADPGQFTPRGMSPDCTFQRCTCEPVPDWTVRAVEIALAGAR